MSVVVYVYECLCVHKERKAARRGTMERDAQQDSEDVSDEEDEKRLLNCGR